MVKMTRDTDRTIALLILFLLIIVVSKGYKTPIQNDGIVQFGNYDANLFGCNNYDPSKGCFVHQDHIRGVVSDSISYGNVATNHNGDSVNALNVAKTEDLVQQPLEPKDVQPGFGDFAEHLYLPSKATDDGITVEKPEVDMRDISINEWRNDTNDKGQGLILSDLRAYQQKYNEEGQENEFKKMSMDEHRQQNIAEWKERVKNSTVDALQNQ